MIREINQGKMRWTWQVACTIRILETENVLVKNLKESPVERAIYGCKNNIKIDLQRV